MSDDSNGVNITTLEVFESNRIHQMDEGISLDDASSAIESLIDDDEDEEYEDDEYGDDAYDTPTDEEDEESSDDHIEDEDLEDEDAEPTKYKVRAAGEEIEVTLEELQKGYSRTADYTRKSQAVAEERRVTEELSHIASQTAEAYAQRLEALAQVVPPAELATLEAEHSYVRQQMAAREHQEFATHVAQERERLVEAIPEWSDKARATKEKRALAEYVMETFGYTEHELNHVTDHRLLLILRKAEAYDKLGKGLRDHPRNVGKTKTLKPGGQPLGRQMAGTRSHNAAMGRLKRSGSTTDAAAVLMGLMND